MPGDEAVAKMSLDASCLEYMGKLLYVETHYGYGWAGGNANLHPPPSFYVRVHRFFSYHDRLRGAVALVEEMGHVQNGFWVVFYTRHPGVFDFTERLASYIVLMAPNELVQGEPEENPDVSEHSPIWRFPDQGPHLSGFGRVAISQDLIVQWNRRSFCPKPPCG